MAAKIWRIRALAPFLVNGQHNEAVDDNGTPIEYEFPEEVAAQIVAAGRASVVEKREA